MSRIHITEFWLGGFGEMKDGWDGCTTEPYTGIVKVLIDGTDVI
jgi:hypothetical protein